MLGYQTSIDKSMNGIKTISDGQSVLSNGVINCTSLTTQTLNATNLVTTSIVSTSIYGTLMTAIQTYITTVGTLLSLTVSGTANLSNLIVSGVTQLLNTSMNQLTINSNYNISQSGTGILTQTSVTANNLLSNIIQNSGCSVTQSGSGLIYQTGSSSNVLKASTVNGQLSQNGNIVQTSGSNTLNDCSISNITQSSTNTITQSGTGINTLKGTTITDLTITNSMTIPSGITMPSATYNGDTSYIGTAKIIQSGSTGINDFNSSTFNSFISLSGNLTMTGGSSTCTLKTPSITGLITCADILQSSGVSTLRSLTCNALTLNTNFDANLSGTGKITQAGTGNNSFQKSTFNDIVYVPTSYLNMGNTTGQKIRLYDNFGSAYRYFGLSIESGTTRYNTADVTHNHIFSSANATNDGFLNSVHINSYGLGIGDIVPMTYKLDVNGISRFSSDILCNGKINNVSNATFDYLKNVTSDIQTQLNATFATDSNNSADIIALETKTTDINYSSLVTTISNMLSLTNMTFTGLITCGAITISPTELGYIDGVTSNIQTQLNSKPNLTTINSFSGSNNVFTGTVQLSGGIIANAFTISNVTLGYLNGMTSNIQTQMNSQMPKSGGTFTGAITLASAGIVSNGLTISNVEVGYLDGVTSNIQTQINSKANLSGATFTGAITLASAGIVSNGLTISNVELGYLDGATSNIQTQLNQTFSNDANNTSAITVLQGRATVLETKTSDLTYTTTSTTSKSTFSDDVIASRFDCPVFKSITNNMVSSSRTVNDTGLGGTYNVSSHYTRTISFICPLSILLISSVYGVGNVFSATFNSITSCTIYKNGVSFSTPTITSANGVNGLWTTGQVTAITAPTVEFYLTTVSGSFTPDDDCNTAIYTVEFVFSVSKTNSSYAKVQINTLTTGKIEYNASCSYTGTRNASYLASSFSEVDNYLNDRYGLFEVGRMNTLDIKTNGNNTTTGNISGNTLSINSVSTTGTSIAVTSPLSISGLCSSSTLNVSSYSTLNKTYYSGMIGAYICEGSIGNNNQLRPIFSSVLAYSNFYVYNQASQSISVGTIHSTAIDLYGTDTNCYLVNPGFRLIVYGLNNYAGSVYLDYTNNTNISTFVIPTSTGVGQSCKLYFNGVQIN